MTTSRREVGKIFLRTEVQTAGASAVLVLVNLIALHLTNLAHRVVERPAMDVLPIGADVLEGEEVTVLGDWKIAELKESIKLINRTLGRILHQILKKLNHRTEWKILVHQGENAISDRIVEDFPVEHNRTVHKANLASSDKGTNRSGNIRKSFEGLPGGVADGIKDAGIVRVIGRHVEGLTVDDGRDSAVFADEDCRIHIFMVFGLLFCCFLLLLNYRLF